MNELVLAGRYYSVICRLLDLCKILRLGDWLVRWQNNEQNQ